MFRRGGGVEYFTCVTQMYSSYLVLMFRWMVNTRAWDTKPHVDALLSCIFQRFFLMICIHLSQISQNLKLVYISCLLLVWLDEFKATNTTSLPETRFTSFIFPVASLQISGSLVLWGSYQQLFAFSPQKRFKSERLFSTIAMSTLKSSFFTIQPVNLNVTVPTFSAEKKTNQRLTFLYLIVIYHCNRLSRSPAFQTIH